MRTWMSAVVTGLSTLGIGFAINYLTGGGSQWWWALAIASTMGLVLTAALQVNAAAVQVNRGKSLEPWARNLLSGMAVSVVVATVVVASCLPAVSSRRETIAKAQPDLPVGYQWGRAALSFIDRVSISPRGNFVYSRGQGFGGIAPSDGQNFAFSVALDSVAALRSCADGAVPVPQSRHGEILTLRLSIHAIEHSYSGAQLVPTSDFSAYADNGTAFDDVEVRAGERCVPRTDDETLGYAAPGDYRLALLVDVPPGHGYIGYGPVGEMSEWRY